MTILFTALSSDERPEVGSCGCHGTASGHIARRYKAAAQGRHGAATVPCLHCVAVAAVKWRLRRGGRTQRLPTNGKHADPSRHPFP